MIEMVHKDIRQQPKTKFTALRMAIQQYKRLFLVDDNVVRFREKELQSHFPFYLFNDVKVLMNLAPVYFEEFSSTYQEALHTVGPELLYKALGTPTRINRYLILLILGAYLHTSSLLEKPYFLDDIASIMLQKASEFQVDNTTATAILSSLMPTDFLPKSGKKSFAMLNALLKEYSDYIFLGEHPLSLHAFPPKIVSEYDLVILKYTQLDAHSGLGISEIEIEELFEAGKFSFGFDLFRGNLCSIPSFGSIVAAKLLIDGQRISNPQSIIHDSLIPRLSEGLRKARQLFMGMSVRDLESKRAIDYCTELITIKRLIGDDGDISPRVRSVLKADSVATPTKERLSATTYCDAYFANIRQAFSEVEKLCNGELA